MRARGERLRLEVDFAGRRNPGSSSLTEDYFAELLLLLFYEAESQQPEPVPPLETVRSGRSAI